jgi:hypothetical protein
MLAVGATAGLSRAARGEDAVVRLRSWERIEIRHRKEHFRQHIKITSDNGAVGYSRALAGVKSLSAAERAVAGANLLDHEEPYDLMVSKNVPERERKTLDIACRTLKHAWIAAILMSSLVLKSYGQDYDAYGGYVKLTSGHPSGYFRLDRINRRDYLVTPEGHGYVALGINHFHTMTRTDYDTVIEELKSWGFNAGCYQGPRWMWNRFPYTQGVNLLSVSQWKPESQFRFDDVFDPKFLAELEERVKRIVAPQAENKMLIGYFLTDMPVWTGKKHGQDWLSFYKSLPANAPGKKVWTEWKEAHPDADEQEFLVVIAEQIYSKGTSLIRKYDNNHLVFSDRYSERDIDEDVIKVAVPYVDALATQPTRVFNREYFDRLHRLSGKPVYLADHVSSFATPEHEITMAQAATSEEDYLKYYRNYVQQVFSLPYIVGYNKCQYVDDLQTKMLKQGLVRGDYTPYSYVRELRELFEGVLLKAYTYPAGSEAP